MPRASLPTAKHERRDRVALPAALPESYELYDLSETPGAWLVLCDIHAPHHDRATIQAAVSHARRRGCVGVLLNGDTLDSHELSDHDKDPGHARYADEVQTVRQLLAWLRERFPKARLVYKEGNHEERLQRYVMKNARALWGLDLATLPAVLELDDTGFDFVGDRRVIAAGKLSVIHGHELPSSGGAMTPAARFLAKARTSVMGGHHHQTSEQPARSIRGRPSGGWSVGCACYLTPRYRRLNNWNHGFAVVDFAADGNFAVDNFRVINGKVV